jgi:hypothetical protein
LLSAIENQLANPKAAELESSRVLLKDLVATLSDLIGTEEDPKSEERRETLDRTLQLSTDLRTYMSGR